MGLGYGEKKNVDEGESSKALAKTVEEDCSKIPKRKNEKKNKICVDILRRYHPDIDYKGSIHRQKDSYKHGYIEVAKYRI